MELNNKNSSKRIKRKDLILESAVSIFSKLSCNKVCNVGLSVQLAPQGRSARILPWMRNSFPPPRTPILGFVDMGWYFFFEQSNVEFVYVLAQYKFFQNL